MLALPRRRHYEANQSICRKATKHHSRKQQRPAQQTGTYQIPRPRAFASGNARQQESCNKYEWNCTEDRDKYASASANKYKLSVNVTAKEYAADDKAADTK